MFVDQYTRSPAMEPQHSSRRVFGATYPRREVQRGQTTSARNQEPTASSAERCIRKAAAERGLTGASWALRMQRRRTKPLRGGPIAPSHMENERLDPRILDAPGGLFGVTEGSSLGDIDEAMGEPGTSPRILTHRFAPG